MYHVNTFIGTDKEVASYEKRMSICLRSNGFSFSVTTSSGLLLSFGDVFVDMAQPMSSLIADIKAFLSEYHIYPVEFSQMHLVLDASSYVWIPASLYDASQHRQYLESVASVSASSMVSAIRHPVLDAWLVYAAEATWITAFRVALPGIDCCAQPYALLSDTLLERAKSHPVMVALLTEEGRKGAWSVDYLVLKQGGLLLSTRRKVEGEQQLLFTSLTMMKRMGIEEPDMEMLLCGAVDRDLFMHLRGYFPHLDLYNGAPHRTLNPQLGRIHAYKYATVLG